jgi:uncharacterized membrane protein
MTPHNDPISEPTLFSATITPNRSLPRTGFLAVMIAIGGISFVTGLVFALMGAWPVLGFLGLDVLLIYWAFRRGQRDGDRHHVRNRGPQCRASRRGRGMDR